MIDPLILRTDPELVRASQRARGESVELVDAALEADVARRAAITEHEAMRAEQKAAGKLVASASPEERPAVLARTKEIAEQVKALAARVTEAEAEFDRLMWAIPNIIEPGVPAGPAENFAVLKTVGTPRTFDFTPRDHLELGELLGAIDTPRGAKVSGARFYYLTGVGARLELALLNAAMAQAVKYDFTPMITPTLVKPEIMAGTGFLGEHSAEVYHLPADDLYLTGTSEVALAGYHADEIIDVSAGPKRYAGWSACYRREAGSGGKDTRGIIRVHQFHKVEMFAYCQVEDAAAEHERLLAWEEEMLKAIDVPYRVIDTAAGDLGASAARKFDCEAWLPTQETYRELTSTSNCTTFQARRLGTRERTENGTRTVATLNGTLATTRWLVAMLENHQQPDGSVVVPEGLRPWVGLDVLEPINSKA